MYQWHNIKVDLDDLVIDKLANLAKFYNIKDSLHASVVWRLKNYTNGIVSS